MTASLSSRVRGLLALAGGAMVAALASGRPELVVVAVPMLLLVGVGLAISTEPLLTVTITLDHTRLIEGATATATATVMQRRDGADRSGGCAGPQPARRCRARRSGADPPGSGSVVVADL